MKDVQLGVELQQRISPIPGPDHHISWLDWLARERLLAALGQASPAGDGLARVDSNHHFWIQSPASCH